MYARVPLGVHFPLGIRRAFSHESNTGWKFTKHVVHQWLPAKGTCILVSSDNKRFVQSMCDANYCKRTRVAIRQPCHVFLVECLEVWTQIIQPHCVEVMIRLDECLIQCVLAQSLKGNIQNDLHSCTISD